MQNLLSVQRSGYLYRLTRNTTAQCHGKLGETFQALGSWNDMVRGKLRLERLCQGRYFWVRGRFLGGLGGWVFIY